MYTVLDMIIMTDIITTGMITDTIIIIIIIIMITTTDTTMDRASLARDHHGMDLASPARDQDLASPVRDHHGTDLASLARDRPADIIATPIGTVTMMDIIVT